MTSLFYVSPLIFGAALGLALAFFVSRIRYVPGSRSLVALILMATLWSGAYALEFLSPSLEMKLFWAKVQYFGIATIPVAWLVFAHRYMESHEWPRSLAARLGLGLIPFLTIVLVWTNDFHHLIWQTTYLETSGPLHILEFHHGTWFWVYWLYAGILLMWGTYKLAKTLLSSVRLYRWQIGLALLAMAIPWLGNLLYVIELGPVAYLDWTPFAFVIAGLLLAVSLFRYQLANIPPIAHQQVFKGQADRLLVLDIRNFIVDLNPAAEKMAGSSREQPIGKPLAQIFPHLSQWVEMAADASEFHQEIVEGEGPDRHFFDLYLSQLTGANARPIGRLVVLHEITQLKQEQARLEQRRAELEQVVSQRTEELRQTVARLEEELSQRTLAEKRFEEVVESAPDAMLVVDRAGAIRLINAQAERLFGYSRQELVGRAIESLMPVQRRPLHAVHTSEFFGSPSIRMITATGLNSTAQRKNGSEFPVELSLAPLNTADGLWAACTVRDLTERTKAEEAQRRLLEEVKQSQEELRLLAIRLQEVQEIERRDIASELHDRIGQNLTGLNLNLQIVENRLDAASNAAVIDRLDDSLRLVEETTRQVRDVMADLHPPGLDEYGLLAALHWYSGVFAQRTGIAARVTGSEFAPRLPPNVELVLFRIVQEALNNVAKHAGSAAVEIELESSEEAASLIVQDNGAGFELQASQTPNGQARWGLINMRQRAASIGGQLIVDSAPGQGTLVRIDLRRPERGD